MKEQRQHRLSPRLKPPVKRKVLGRPPIPMLREKILGSALDLFAEKTFDQVSIDKISARAGVSKGSIYREFRSKEELYTIAVIEGYVDLRARIVAAIAQAPSIPAAVTIIVNQIVLYFWSRLEFFDLLHNRAELSRTYEHRYRRERQKLARIIVTILADGMTNGTIRNDAALPILVESLFGMIRGVLRYGRGDGALSQAEVVRTVAGVFLNGCSKQCLKQADSLDHGQSIDSRLTI
jgi:AcrR family transcriptional regulator